MALRGLPRAAGLELLNQTNAASARGPLGFGAMLVLSVPHTRARGPWPSPCAHRAEHGTQGQGPAGSSVPMRACTQRTRPLTDGSHVGSQGWQAPHQASGDPRSPAAPESSGSWVVDHNPASLFAWGCACLPFLLKGDPSHGADVHPAASSHLLLLLILTRGFVPIGF